MTEILVYQVKILGYFLLRIIQELCVIFICWFIIITFIVLLLSLLLLLLPWTMVIISGRGDG